MKCIKIYTYAGYDSDTTEPYLPKRRKYVGKLQWEMWDFKGDKFLKLIMILHYNITSLK
jgi:hypothetical protein